MTKSSLFTAPSRPSSTQRPPLETTLLCLGLFRTGSASLVSALAILGYPEVWHLSKLPRTSTSEHAVWIRAAETYFPNLPSHNPHNPPFTRADWDEVLGTWEGAAGAAAIFAPQLIEAYPDAKVIYLRRPARAWVPSMKVMAGCVFAFPRAIARYVIDPLMGGRKHELGEKFILGFSGMRSPREMLDPRSEEKWVQIHAEHEATVRRMVPPERLLVMELGEGWERLCEFLGKEVPDVPFPRGNTAKDFREMYMKGEWEYVRMGLLEVLLPRLFVVGAVTTVGVFAALRWRQTGSTWWH